MADRILSYEDYRDEPVPALSAYTGRQGRERREWTYRQWLDYTYRELRGEDPPPVPTERPAEAWSAFVNAGRWMTQCEGCRAGLIVTHTDPLVLCPLCPTPWAAVTFPAPSARGKIEAELLRQPGHRLTAPVRRWVPGQPLSELKERTARAEAIRQRVGDKHLIRALSIGAARVWAVGEILTAANENTYISDILDDLAGRNGVIQLEDSLEIEDGTGGRYVGLPKGATNQRPSHGAGRVRFNETLDLPEFSDGSTWKRMGDAPELTYDTLNDANQVGTGSEQVARGNHSHVPSQPAAPTVESVSGENDELDVTWTAPFAGSSAITSYTISYSLAGENSFTEETSSGSGTSYTIDGLSPYTEYDVRVAATNNVNTGLWSPVSTARTNDGRIYAAAESDSARFLVTVDAGEGLINSVHGFRTQEWNPSSNFSLAWHDGTLYASFNSRLHSVNRETGETSEIGSGLGGISCIQSDGSTLYGIRNNRLYSIDPVTASSTVIGSSQQDLISMAYDGTNSVMYGRTGNRLYSVNLSTGAMTAVGNSRSPNLAGGIYWDGSRLVGASTATVSDNGSLYEVSTTDGGLSLLHDDLYIDLYGLAFVPA